MTSSVVSDHPGEGTLNPFSLLIPWEEFWTYLHSLNTSLSIEEFYSSHPNVCLYSLSIVCGLILFLALLTIRLCLKVLLDCLAKVTGKDLLKELFGVEDTPDTLRENPFWAGTHERRRFEAASGIKESKVD
jgi:hypothetical protein